MHPFFGFCNGLGKGLASNQMNSRATLGITYGVDN